MRVLALDYGSARCGCAISDPDGAIATPIEPILRPTTRRGLAALARLVQDRGVELIVVGLPISLRGEDTEQTRETRRFADTLRGRLADVPVELYDERFTTVLAQRTPAASTSEDSRAAAHLLADWLDSRSR